MIIVAGRLYVTDRERYLDGCADLIRTARTAPGCEDFYLAADPVEPDRINVYEQWATAADVETFRRSGPSDEQTVEINDAAVFQHDVASTTKL